MLKKYLLLIMIITSLFSEKYYYMQKFSQFKMLDSKDIVMLGDSITDRGVWSDLLKEQVSNRGINGDTTYGLYTRINYIGSPKIVFLMIGINDIFLNVPTNDIFSNYKKIVETLLKKNINVYIESVLYIGNKFDKKIYEVTNNRVQELNTLLSGYASRTMNVTFIDLNLILSKNKILKYEYTNDGIHLLGNAYVLWAEKIEQILQKNENRELPTSSK